MSFKRALAIQLTVIFTLFLREMKGRFGGYRLGILWALIEPLVHIAVLSLIFGYIRHQSFNLDFAQFVALGIIPWLAFRKTLGGALNIINANAGLFNYSRIKPFDVIFAKVCVEFFTYLMAGMCLALVFYMLNHPFALKKPLELILVYSLLMFFTFSTCLCAAVLSSRYNELRKIIPILLRPLYFMSGLFYAIEDIPSQFHGYLLSNPLFHLIAFSRSTFLDTVSLESIHISYVLHMSVGLLFIGVMLYRYYRDRLVAT